MQSHFLSKYSKELNEHSKLIENTLSNYVSKKYASCDKNEIKFKDNNNNTCKYIITKYISHHEFQNCYQQI